MEKDKKTKSGTRLMVRVGGSDYPAYLTNGALLRFKDQTGHDLLRTFDRRELKRTLKDAYRRTGKRIAAIAKRSVEAGGINDAGKLAKGVRVRVYPRGGGFMVTVKPHGKTGYIVNRHGKEKPVLMWAEEGTVERFPRNWRKRFLVHTDAGFRWVGRSRGKMPSYHFLKEAEEQGPGIVEEEIGKEIEAATERRAARLGWL